MSKIIAVVPVKYSTAYWLILDCYHWFRWSGNQIPKTGEEFDCLACKPLPKIK